MNLEVLAEVLDDFEYINFYLWNNNSYITFGDNNEIFARDFLKYTTNCFVGEYAEISHNFEQYQLTTGVSVSDNDFDGIMSYNIDLDQMLKVNLELNYPEVVGHYTAEHSYTDVGNNSTISGLIVISDQTPPEISLNGNSLYTVGDNISYQDQEQQHMIMLTEM